MRYFIDYRFDESTEAFQPIGIWMHNPVDGDVDMYYADPDCHEADEANWILNRLVEAGLKTPPYFLDFHQQRAGYHGMRGSVLEVETAVNYDDFGRKTLITSISWENNAVAD